MTRVGESTVRLPVQVVPEDDVQSDPLFFLNLTRKGFYKLNVIRKIKMLYQFS